MVQILEERHWAGTALCHPHQSPTCSNALDSRQTQRGGVHTLRHGRLPACWRDAAHLAHQKTKLIMIYDTLCRKREMKMARIQLLFMGLKWLGTDDEDYELEQVTEDGTFDTPLIIEGDSLRDIEEEDIVRCGVKWLNHNLLTSTPFKKYMSSIGLDSNEFRLPKNVPHAIATFASIGIKRDDDIATLKQDETVMTLGSKDYIESLN